MFEANFTISAVPSVPLSRTAALHSTGVTVSSLFDCAHPDVSVGIAALAASFVVLCGEWCSFVDLFLDGNFTVASCARKRAQKLRKSVPSGTKLFPQFAAAWFTLCWTGERSFSATLSLSPWHQLIDVEKELTMVPRTPNVPRGVSVISSSLYTEKLSQGYYLDASQLGSQSYLRGLVFATAPGGALGLTYV